MAMPVVLRFSPRACSSKRTRSSSILAFSTSSACGADTACLTEAYVSRLKTLRGLTPYEFIHHAWTKEPDRFRLDPSHHIPGPYT